MILMQHDDLIQALAPHTPNQTLNIGILPGTLWSDQHFLEAHVPHTPSKGYAVNAVAITQQIPGCLVLWKCFDDLLCSLLSGRMFRHVEVHDATPFVCKNHED